MALLSTVLTTFSTTLAKEIAEKVSSVIIKELTELIQRLDKFKAIDERGQNLKNELALARTDEEYKAILRKVNAYFADLSNR